MKDLTFTQLAEAFLAYAHEGAEGPKDVVETLRQYEFDDPDLPEKVRRVLEETPGPEDVS